MEANMKTLRADNEVALTKHEAAIGRFQSSNEKAIGELRTDNEKAIGELRTTIEKNSKTLIFQTIGVVAAVAGIASLLIKVFGF